MSFKNRTVLLAGAGLASLSSSPALAIDVVLPSPPPTTVTNFPALGGCTSFAPIGRVRGTINDGFTFDQLDIEVTDTTNAVLFSETRSQRVGSLNTAFSSGNLRLPLSPEPSFPVTISVYENDGTGRGALVGSYNLPRSAFANCYPTSLNAAPLADAGSDQTNVIPGSLVTLDGTASSDPDNDTLTYSWTQISGPAVVLDDATSPTPSFTAPGGASTTPVVFQLVVNDGTVNSAPVTVTVSMQDNIGTAQAQIGEFLAQRNAILLSNQPDLQRRIDRLNGAGNGSNADSLASALAPMNDRMPLSVFAAQGRVQASSSLAQASGSAPRGVAGSWDIWAEARFIDTDFAAREGTATLLYAGIDNAVSDDLLLGLMGQYDELDAKGSVTTGVLDGEGWMVGPYATVRLADRLFLDARAAYGETRNRISPFGTYTDVFDTDRLLLAGTLTGEFEPAPGLVIRPEAAIIWIDEEQKAYIDSLGSPIAAQGLDAGQLSFAPRIMYSAKVDDQFTLRPFVEARGIYSFGDGASAVLGDDTRMRVEGGLDLLGSNGLRIGLSGFHDGIGNGGFSATGARLSVGFTF